MSNAYAKYSGIGGGVGGGGVTSLNGQTGALTLLAGTNITIVPGSGTLTINSSNSGGTVTSVALSDGSTTPIYTVSGSPVTSSGTLTLTLSNQTANKVFAGPTSGGATQPTFRLLVASDIPSLSATYANTSLSNLTLPTSINQDLIPATFGRQIGKLTQEWSNLYIQNIIGVNTGTATNFNINLVNGSITSAGETVLDLANGVLNDNVGGTSVDFNNRFLLDNSTENSVDYGNRFLVADDGTTNMFGWATAGTLNAFTNTITNVVDPTNPQDAATKNYVDTHTSGGTVTSVSVVSANGLAGTVATATTTPAITLSTTVTGIVKGNGTALSAATAGTDYVIPSGSITGTASNITASSNSTLTTLSSLALPASQLTGTLQAAQEPAHTGDVTNTAGSLALSLVATTNSTLTTLSSLSLPGAQVTGNISGNAANVTGTVAETHGGTNQTSYTTGDILYASASNTLSKLPIGPDGQVITSSAGVPTWQPAPGTVSAFFASSQVNTLSSPVTSTLPTFTTFSNSPAFTFTPTITGTYKVYSSIPLFLPVLELKE